MCGLVGIASVAPQADRAWLPLARDSLTHRGPDDAGLWWSEDGRVGLAHRRLSVIDLTSAGHQPMRFREQGLSIIFNGEIYNHRELRVELKRSGYTFKSQSDTEVLLAAYDAWGSGCLAKLNGMFAFALYDSFREKLLLVRDRVGEKPLFYYLGDGSLYFASELKALMSNPLLPRRLDPAALDCYLAMGFVPGDRCILQGFNKLSPAHALDYDLRRGTAKVWRYWQLPDFHQTAEPVQGSETALLDELEALMQDAIGRQLVADVPVGVLLSGGVDSSLITAMAVRHSNKVRTFTIGFPGHGAMDETEHARLVARHFGTEHTELVAEPTTADLIPKLVCQFDEPMVDSSIIPTYLVSQLIQERCKVALGGDGGDELFGGYGHYSRLLWMEKHLNQVPRHIRRSVAVVAERLMPLGVRGTNIRTWLMALGENLQQELPLIASYFDEISRRKLMRHYEFGVFSAESIRRERIPREADLLSCATRMDFCNYLAEDILVKVDRASMLNSLEIRAPLLDYRLVEFAFGKVPSHLKATSNDKKILLKRLAARLLPPEFDRRRKQGFSIPLAQWLKKGPFRELFWDVLTDSNCFFDHRTIMGLLKGQDRGRSNGERLFALVQFELWRQEYDVSI